MPTDQTYTLDEAELFGHMNAAARRDCELFFSGNQFLDPAGKDALRDMLVERLRTGVVNLAGGDPRRHVGACVTGITEMALYSVVLYRWARPPSALPELERYDVLADYVAAVIRSYGRHVAKWDAINSGEAGRA